MGTDLLPVAFAWLLTWWVHSGLLLGTALVIALFRREMSPRSREWLWKSAVVLPWFTAPLQYGLETALIWRWELPSEQETLAEMPKDSANASIAEDVPTLSRSEATKPSSSKSVGLMAELSPSPAIAEKPFDPPIMIETIVADAAPIPATAKPESRVTVKEPSAASPMPAKPERPKPTAEIPQESVQPSPIAQSPWFVPAVVGLVLAVGILGGLRFLWLWMSLSRLMQRLRRLTSGMAYEELQKLLGQSKIRGTIKLVESAECSVPAAGGLFRRVIVLPADAQDRLSRDELRALLAHELGHHARGDVWWLWLGRGLCHVLPVQPLYFWAVREWHKAAEPLCDDWAIERNVSPMTLAKSLTEVAQWGIAKPSLIPAATNVPSQLIYRVERLLNRDSTPTPHWKRRLMPLLVLLLACALLAFAPLVHWSQAENMESATNSAPALDRPSPESADEVAADGITIFKL